MIKEYSKFRIIWNVFILVSIIVSCFLIPLKTVFQDASTMIPVSLLYIIDIFMIADIVLNFFTSYRKKGFDVHEQKQIVIHYLKTYFFVDFIANIPLIYLFDAQNSYFLQMLPMFRLLRLVRMNVIWKGLDELIGLYTGYLRMFRVLLIIVILMHWEACAWFLSAQIEGFKPDSWVVRMGLLNESSEIQYLRSLYWTVITMTTIGYGDIVPVRNIEYIFATVIALVGASSFAFIIANMASLIGQLNSTRSAFKNRMEVITQYFSHRKLPPEVNRKIRNYYEYMWSRYKGYREDVFFEDIPNSIRIEILIYLTKDLIEKAPVFKYCSSALRNELLLALKRQSFPPGSYVTREGEVGRAIYYIVQGNMEIIAGEGNVVHGILSEGDYFGDLSMILVERKTASVKSLTYSDVFVLEINDFNRIRTEYPEFNEILNRISSERVEKISALLLDKIVL